MRRALSIADLLFGRPLATAEHDSERVGPLAAIPILGLDALSSAAYGPEAMLTVLMPLGMRGLSYATVLMLCILAVMLIVFISYRQTIDAYPNGGGAYTVVKENIGPNTSLLAAASIALDYLLNVAVAISAGVGALASAVPALLPHTLPLCLLVLVFLTVMNLRGVRATGLAFMIPTYLFVASIFAVLGTGALQALFHGGHPVRMATPHGAYAAATLSDLPFWLFARAFASGCTALTGVEAVSNGVPIFREPREVGARRTLASIVAILAVFLVGIAINARAFGVLATPPGREGYESVVSQIVSAIVGRGPAYYVTIASVITVLALSANTSFAAFPRLCRMLAGDRYLPEPFLHRGRRLAFSHGIVVLAVLSGALLIVFGGITDALIPLFAIGAFLAFTMSQSGMVMHWRKLSGARARRGLALNALGALTTGLTAVIVLVSKFTEGAWISALLIVAMLALFRGVRAHLDFLDRATATNASLEVDPPRSPIAVVPLRRWDALAHKAMRFAVGFAPDVVAVQVLTGDSAVDDLTPRWRELVEDPARRLGIRPPTLVVMRSEYRRLFEPLLSFVTDLSEREVGRQVAVIVPEVVERRWYHTFLHNHTASVLKALLLFRGGPRVVVVNTPWYL